MTNLIGRLGILIDLDRETGANRWSCLLDDEDLPLLRPLSWENRTFELRLRSLGRTNWSLPLPAAPPKSAPKSFWPPLCRSKLIGCDWWLLLFCLNEEDLCGALNWLSLCLLLELCGSLNWLLLCLLLELWLDWLNRFPPLLWLSKDLLPWSRLTGEWGSTCEPPKSSRIAFERWFPPPLTNTKFSSSKSRRSGLCRFATTMGCPFAPNPTSRLGRSRSWRSLKIRSAELQLMRATKKSCGKKKKVQLFDVFSMVTGEKPPDKSLPVIS